VRDRETGRLVAPRDPAALAVVLAELAADPGQRARLGAAAAVDVRGRFARPRLLDEVQALYDRLLG
jgi:D-inositol-3-phosphate glycosyltransferase